LLALAHIQRIKRIWIGRDSEQRSLDPLEINASICFDSCVTFQRRIVHTTEEADERFYRDTESIAFPPLSDEQLETLESLGTRRKVNRGEIVYKGVSATCLSILS